MKAFLLILIIQILTFKSLAIEELKPVYSKQTQIDFKIPDNKNEWENFKREWKVKLGENVFRIGRKILSLKMSKKSLILRLKVLAYVKSNLWVQKVLFLSLYLTLSWT